MLYHLLIHSTSNTRGIRLGVMALLIGAATAFATGSLAIGMLPAALFTFFLSLPRPLAPGQAKRPFPWLLLLPLPVWGVLLLILAGPMWIVQEKASQIRSARGAVPADPRLARLKQDEGEMAQPISPKLNGEDQIASEIRSALGPIAGSPDAHIAVHVDGAKMLILAMIPTLSDITSESRLLMLDQIQAVAVRNSINPSNLYIGIKGDFFFGCTQTPPGIRQIGRIVSDASLAAFYPPDPSVKVDHADAGTSTLVSSDGKVSLPMRNGRLVGKVEFGTTQAAYP